MKATYISIIILIILFQPMVSAERPTYEFSDNVFSELPPFPEDFFEIKTLLSQQRITAWQFGEEYLQPELLPGWTYWSNKTYTQNRSQYGSYGIFIYPSLFQAYNVEEGDSFSISFLIYANWGITKYQGCSIYFNHSKNVRVMLANPTNPDFLLSPTYPVFKLGWMQKVKIDIDVFKTGNYTIEIMEGKPCDCIEPQWIKKYGTNYTSGNSILTQKIPRCRIKIYPPLGFESLEEEQGNVKIFFMFIFLIALFIGFIVAFIVKTWKDKNERKQSTYEE